MAPSPFRSPSTISSIQAFVSIGLPKVPELSGIEPLTLKRPTNGVAATLAEVRLAEVAIESTCSPARNGDPMFQIS